jgi:hypothetical protein
VTSGEACQSVTHDTSLGVIKSPLGDYRSDTFRTGPVSNPNFVPLPETARSPFRATPSILIFKWTRVGTPRSVACVLPGPTDSDGYVEWNVERIRRTHGVSDEGLDCLEFPGCHFQHKFVMDLQQQSAAQPLAS